MAIFEIGLKKDDPGFLSLTISQASAGTSTEVLRQLVHLRTIIEHPAFMMMKEATVIIHHVKSGSETELALVGQAGCLLPFIFGARQGWQEERDKDRNDGDDGEEFEECEAGIPVAARSQLD